jgi:hypothetical protein
MVDPLDDDFLARLTTAQPTLSPKMSRLAGFLAENYVQAAFMTTREIAAAASVSLATVVRFPAVLSYCDFDALRASIQDRVNIDLTAVERIRAISAASKDGAAGRDGTVGLFAKSVRSTFKAGPNGTIVRARGNELWLGEARTYAIRPYAGEIRSDPMRSYGHVGTYHRVNRRHGSDRHEYALQTRSRH